MSNNDWYDLFQKEFNISRRQAKNILHMIFVYVKYERGEENVY